ncbi:ABC transporter substrate-binding protein [Fundicoccus sp. Sow4_D5]|uniref:ABC transporter substrate-binding protein n=1 Tax=Fundicoccus sp. Sow4_D5 TaxID=3438782 RepID=UPI003F8DF5FF
MKRLKSLLTNVLLGSLVLSSVGGPMVNAQEEETETYGSGDRVLEIWSFTNEINTMIEDYYMVNHPDLDYTIEIVNIPTAEFEAKLDPIVGTDAAPDVILLEQNFVKKYVESGLMADLSQFENVTAGSENTLDYVKGIGTSGDGVYYANSFQAAPGAFFYRASIAEDLLGITDPEEMQAKMSDWEGFIETAREIKEASNGEVYMISGIDDLRFAYLGTREQGWVVDGSLVIDPKMDELLDTALLMNEEGLMLDAPPESEAYFGGMSQDEIFGYSLPSWGLHFWLKPNGGEATKGDWRMVEGPSAYFRGGTWLGAMGNSDMLPEASDLLTYITTDPEFLTQWALDTGDIVSDVNVVEEIKGEYSDEFLGGQNHYAAFADLVGNINGDIITEYDQALNVLFVDHALTPYSKGEVDKETAISNFKAQVQNSFPNLIIE